MEFSNENTFYRASLEGRENLFHWEYEKAYDRLLAEIEGGVDHPNLIDGKESYCESKFEDTSPSDHELQIGTFQKGSAEEVRKAVEAAHNSFREWSRTDFSIRIGILRKVAQLMRRDKFTLAAAITIDNGKNRYEAIADVDEAIDFIEYYCLEMEKNEGYVKETIPPFPDEHPWSMLLPYGPWAVICPFNFPVAITTGMTAGVLVTGNTVVLKPSSPVPLPVYMVARILTEGGVPDGVLNFVAGPGSTTGETLIGNRKVRGIAFTGSRQVGLKMMRSSVEHPSRMVIAEMGGKNPIIVTESAEVEGAVSGVLNSAFGYAGQKCSACSRVYVGKGIIEEFLGRLVEKTESLTVGDPADQGTFMGPVIHHRAVEDFVRYSNMAAHDGRIVTGGHVIEERELKRGNFVEPTIVSGLPDDHYLLINELFLPFLCVQEFGGLEEALRKANAVEYGLTAGIFARSEEEISYFFDHIEAGVVYANRIRGGSTGAMVGGQPFVGWKASGSTGKGTGGEYYLPQFMREQSRTVCRR